MQYMAENVDTNKALDHIEVCRKGDSEKERLEMVSTQKFHEGVRHGLDMAEEIFKCRNYEKQGVPVNYDDCVGSAIEEIAKAIDIRTHGILEAGKDGKEMCAEFARRILLVFERKAGMDDMRTIMEAAHNGKTQI